MRQTRTTFTAMRFKDRIHWINPFHAEYVAIHSELAPAECVARLRESVVSRYSPRTWFFADEDWPVIGGVSGTRFWMQRIHRFVRPWSLQEASGVVEPLGAGSLISVRVAMKPVNAILHVILAALVLLAALAAALLIPKDVAGWPLILWAAWPLAALAAYSIDRLWWAGDAAYLRRFISEITGTRQSIWRPYPSVERT